MDYEQVLGVLVEWAVAEPNVRALVLTGSAAATETHALSDRDLEVYARNVAALLDDETWWSRLGDVLVVERTENELGQPTRLVYYVSGKLDFTLLPAERLHAAVYERAFEVLVDKDGGSRTARRVEPQRVLPTGAEFSRCVNEAYAAALMCAKALARDELWPSKIRDEDFKWRLLQMIEWDHWVRHGLDYDTRHLARHMNTWMDDDIRGELVACWGHLDRADAKDALYRTFDLFARLAARTASHLELATVDHDRIRREIDSILDHGSAASPHTEPRPDRVTQPKRWR